MSALTPRQQEILTWIATFMGQHGCPPTRAEIGEHFGFRSPNAAEAHLRALARKGAIELRGGQSRGIRLTSLAEQLLEALPPGALPPGVVAKILPAATTANIALPLVGRVAAGSPILAEQNIEESYHLDERLFRPAPHYLLRVQGMSMRDVGILDGDLLAVHRTPEARNRQVVVARLDDEVTVKRFWRQGDQVRLIAENPEFADIEVDLREQTLVIEGLGVGVLRNQQAL